jgi:hypothetical protein
VPSIELRPFHRGDREQVAALVNAHLEAMLPGVSVSVNAVMSQLERVLDYAIEGEDEAHLAFAKRLGWRELARTQRGWRRE